MAKTYWTNYRKRLNPTSRSEPCRLTPLPPTAILLYRNERLCQPRQATMKVTPGTLLLVFFLLLSLAGCATPNYGLKPAPVPFQSSSTMGDIEYINETGRSANLSVAADVDDFLKSKYLIVVLIVSNTSGSALDLGYDSVELQCGGLDAERPVASLEPESLVAKFSAQRRSGESSRGWGTFFQALASAHHDPGANADYGKVSQSINTGATASRLRSQEESQMIRGLDRLLIRRCQVLSGTKKGGVVFFPFSKSELYKVRVRIAEETHEFQFRLRTY